MVFRTSPPPILRNLKKQVKENANSEIIAVSTRRELVLSYIVQALLQLLLYPIKTLFTLSQYINHPSRNKIKRGLCVLTSISMEIAAWLSAITSMTLEASTST